MKISFSKLFDNKRFLMFFSLALAIIAWLITVTAINPNTRDEIDGIEVNIAEAPTTVAILEPLNLNIVEGAFATVSAVVEGPRYIVGGLSGSDIDVVAELSGISSYGTYDVKLSGSDKFGKGFTVLEIKPKTIQIRVDRKATKKFSISSDIEGLKVPDGYIRSDVVVSPKEVTITGPEADVNRIDKCVAAAVFDEPLTANRTVKSDIMLYDSEGNEIDKSLLTMDPVSVDITVPVLKKKNLPVKFEYLYLPKGMPRDPLDYTLSEGSIEVAGPANMVDLYEDLNIGYVDFSEITKDKVFVFPVELPSGFINLEDVTRISLSFDTENMVTGDFAVTNIKATNVPVNYEVTVETPRITGVHMIGEAEIMETLTSDDLVAEVDISDREITPGPYNLPVRISAPSKGIVWATGEYTAVVTIKEK
ncbi:CdaR family protein [Anaerotruncus rubiinfantis]|uniref:CdaR family protein n=1 Tax=Anaerotruncus rubiinfantis TaxID=1720200 RepID=UPI00082E2856|nr:CdaR family protein [Anaerotruncus rubiinfantis]